MLSASLIVITLFAGWEVDPEILTRVPTDTSIGVSVRNERFPLRAHVSVGVVAPYVQAFVPETDPVGQVVHAVASPAVLMRLHGGWKPFRRRGFELTGGFAVVGAGGVVMASQLAAAVGYALPYYLDGPYTLSSTITLLELETSWTWRLGKKFRLRAGIGYTFAAGADSRLDPAFYVAPVFLPVFETLSVNVGAVISDFALTYGRLPSASFALAYDF